MLKDDTWADDLSILLTVLLCERTLYIFDLPGMRSPLRYFEIDNLKAPILIAHSTNHFVSVIPTNNNSKLPLFPKALDIKLEKTLGIFE